MKTFLNALAAILAAFCITCCTSKQDATLLSPDGKLQVTITLADSGAIYYTLHRNGSPVMKSSRLGLIREDEDFSVNMKLVSIAETEPVKDSYTTLHGKKNQYSYDANKKVYHFKNSNHQKLDIVFQVSNDGVAFRYYFPDASEDLKKITQEVTSFYFSDEGRAWIQPRAKAKSGWESSNPSYEEHYLQDTTVNTLGTSETGWIFPALFKEGDNWILISETAPDRDYCASRLLRGEHAGELAIGFPEAVESFPGGPVYPQSKLPWQTPWRIIAIGSLKTIVESTLGTDLAKPAIDTNTDYIKPGRASWSWVSLKDDSIVYNVQKRFIDYASDMKWEYCLIDVNWDTKIGYDSIKALVDYAASKHVGIILWYNSAGSWNTVKYHPRDLLLTKEGREKEFSRIATMGVKGIKVDFFGGDGQSVMAYYQDILEDAAKHKLLVNCHGSTLPRGLQRTYPNLVSMEAVKGMEFVTFSQADADLQPNHCAMLPFTRNVYDPMDFTPVYFSEIPNVQRKTTQAFELALAVLFHSGVQHYAEKPEGMRAVPDYIQTLMRDIPVAWEETQFVDGYPGKYVVMARKVKDTWYIAGINGETADRALTLNLPFLKQARGVLTTEGSDSRSFSQREVALDDAGSLAITIKGNGGFVVQVK
jgi:alpha-glucosidase